MRCAATQSRQFSRNFHKSVSREPLRRNRSIRLHSQEWLCSGYELLLLVVPGQAAVQEEGGAGGVVGVAGGEEGSEIGDVIRSAEALEWDVGEERIQFGRIVEEIFVNG